MELYYITGDKLKAKKHFEQFANLLRKELSINPNERVQKLYKSIY